MRVKSWDDPCAITHLATSSCAAATSCQILSRNLSCDFTTGRFNVVVTVGTGLGAVPYISSNGVVCQSECYHELWANSKNGRWSTQEWG